MTTAASPAESGVTPAEPPPAAATILRELPVPPAESEAGFGAILPWLIGGLLAVIAFAAFMLLRRRRRTDDLVYADSYGEEPAYDPAPAPAPDVSGSATFAGAVPIAAPAPLAAAAPFEARPVEQAPDSAAGPVERISLGEPDADDVAALAAGSEAPADRPWLEFLLRPVRAGTTSDDTVVEFELTVGNTGSVPASDVRISTWMFAAGSAAGTEMERMLIEPPADAQHQAVSIPAGDGARVEAALSLPKAGVDEPVLPVVVADARYTLPDGSEGRTSASFEVGLPAGEALEPFPTDRASGLLESVEARLRGELERA
ncbi:hypothetical protein [Sphingosinicella sp. CPCC 101087]|uniref:hypothetical protein n=1 Tax=Sphingosinicella sp. CPCC 101087 TaxID=2497754 RepID=UPI0019822ABB|nr:hypothetical protein [Sphingosinicella sp. CPCC 101087]